MTKNSQPLVSVILTTKNEEKNVEACLKSIKNQTYKPLETLVIDNNSTDNTTKIAQEYTKLVYIKGPERSAQRNFGAKKATGRYLIFIDADMILSKNVIKDCVETLENNKVGGVIIPEESFGEGIWARAKTLERSFYIGNEYIEAARFFSKNSFNKVGGFDLNLTGPEDWDLSQRVKKEFGLDRVKSLIKHNEGKLLLVRTLKKKYYYSKKIAMYKKKYIHTSTTSMQLNPLYRYKLFFSKPEKIYQYPTIFFAMLLMKTLEMFAGFVGIYIKR